LFLILRQLKIAEKQSERAEEREREREKEFFITGERGWGKKEQPRNPPLPTHPNCIKFSLTMKQSGPCKHVDSPFKPFEN
jgi:hypothetical protein